MRYTEAQLRDLLAENLELIEPGLALVKKEAMVTWSQEGRDKSIHGYIDILAVDKEGNHVIIEIKKEKQASRAAIHEVFKYLDGIVDNYSLRYDEIRIMIVSTIWEELNLVFPIAEKYKGINLEGYYIEIDEKEYLHIKSIQKRKANEAKREREFSKYALIGYYKDKSQFDDLEIERFTNLYHSMHIENYMMIGFENVGDRVNDYRYAVFIAEPLQSFDTYAHIFQHSNQYRDDTEIWKKDIDYIHFEAMDVVHAMGDNCISRLEMAYASNLRTLIYSDCWKQDKAIVGSKITQTKSILAKTFSEITGGLFGWQYKGSYSSGNRAMHQRNIEQMRAILEPVAIWRDAIHNALYDIKGDFFCVYMVRMDKRLIPTLKMYSNYVLRDNMLMPHADLEFSYNDGSDIEICCRMLQLEKNDKTINEVLSKYYPKDDIYAYMQWSWGGYNNIDSQIARDLGFRFFVVKAIRQKNKQGQYYMYNEIGYERISQRMYETIRNTVNIDRKILEELKYM